LGNISNDSILASEADSTQTETTQSSYSEGDPKRIFGTNLMQLSMEEGYIKGHDVGRAHEMKAHLTLKCKRRVPKDIRIKVLRDIQNEDGSTSKKKRKSDYPILTMDVYYNTKEAIDKAKETRANKSLIKWIVCSGISFSTFDSPYFEDFTKLLNPGYNSPKRTTLATSILDVEAANITLKIEKELLKSKNLTLCVDSWCSPLKRSIYAFVIMTDEKKQYIYSLRDFSMSSHTANFNAERIREVIENVGPEKFVAVVSDAESAMIAAKRLVATQYPHILPVRCIAHHMQLISSSICHLLHARAILSNCQTVIKFFRNYYIAGATLNQEIISTFTVSGNLKSSTKTRWSTVLEQDPQIFNRVSAVKELIGDRQFWIDVEQLRDILRPVKRAVKNVELQTTLLANVFVELVKMAIQSKKLLFYIIANFDEILNIYKNHILKKALEIWK
ncbi:31792_t:CDS:2, partial [Racocetra persica]